MYYNKNNWSIEGFDTNTGFDTLAQRMTALGQSAIEVPEGDFSGHNDILINVFKLIGQQIT